MTRVTFPFAQPEGLLLPLEMTNPLSQVALGGFSWPRASGRSGPEAGPASFTRAGPACIGALFPRDIHAEFTSVLKVSSSSSSSAALALVSKHVAPTSAVSYAAPAPSIEYVALPSPARRRTSRGRTRSNSMRLLQSCCSAGWLSKHSMSRPIRPRPTWLPKPSYSRRSKRRSRRPGSGPSAERSQWLLVFVPECRGQPVAGELDGNPGRRPKNRAMRSQRTRTRLDPEAHASSVSTQPTT